MLSPTNFSFRKRSVPNTFPYTDIQSYKFELWVSAVSAFRINSAKDTRAEWILQEELYHTTCTVGINIFRVESSSSQNICRER
jgi:hypothetical protein